jgi:hypothetical protein
MTPAALQSLVTQAVELDREIHDLTDRLKLLKGELITEACARPDAERPATDGGGWSWTAPGKDGCVARVIAPAAKLRSTLDPDTKAHAKILARFGDAAKRLFTKRVVMVPVTEFRAAVEQEFPPAQAAKLIETCETDSNPRVEFETAERGQ